MASNGVEMLPPAAITTPTKKPIIAQNFGFEEFIGKGYVLFNLESMK